MESAIGCPVLPIRGPVFLSESAFPCIAEHNTHSEPDVNWFRSFVLSNPCSSAYKKRTNNGCPELSGPSGQL